MTCRASTSGPWIGFSCVYRPGYSYREDHFRVLALHSLHDVGELLGQHREGGGGLKWDRTVDGEMKSRSNRSVELIDLPISHNKQIVPGTKTGQSLFASPGLRGLLWFGSRSCLIKGGPRQHPLSSFTPTTIHHGCRYRRRPFALAEPPATASYSLGQ